MYKANPASVPRSERIVRRATCPAQDNQLGRCVRIVAPRSNNLWRVAAATDATVTSVTPAVGVIIKKLSPTVCYVQFHGTTPFTVYSGLTPGNAYVVGTDGFPATEGGANYPAEVFQGIGIATSDDELFVQPSLGGAGFSPQVERYFDQPLVGAQDGVNTVFLCGLAFVASGPQAQSVYVNGIRQRAGLGNDYAVSEPSGIGTGYNTITFAYAPAVDDYLTIDFVPA